MTELIKPKDAILLNQASEELEIPSEVLGIRSDGVIIPKLPFLKIGSHYSQRPFETTLSQKWDTFMSATRHLVNPYTPFNKLTMDLLTNAAAAFIAARSVALDSSNDGIVLPYQFRFYEGITVPYSYDIPRLNRTALIPVWNPPDDSQLYIQDFTGESGINFKKIVTFHLVLTAPQGKSHMHSISFKQ